MADFIAQYTGQLAALSTSVLWTATSTFFTLGGRRVGSVVVNRMRLLFGFIFLLLAHFVLGVDLPLNAEPDRIFWLSLSGIVGLLIGDALLFQALVLIGPRLGMLMLSLAPVIAAVLAWVFLGEVLSATQIFGMLLTLIGVAIVIVDGNHARSDPLDRRTYLLGILMGVGSAATQAVGLITAKQGLHGDFSPLSGTLIRMFAAASVMWSLTLIRRQAGPTIRRLRAQPDAFRYIVAGSVTGPFLGVTFSLVAVQNTVVGIASTLMALPPLLLIPVGRLVFKESFGWRAVLGTLVAIVGVAVLFLV